MFHFCKMRVPGGWVEADCESRRTLDPGLSSLAAVVSRYTLAVMKFRALSTCALAFPSACLAFLAPSPLSRLGTSPDGTR